MPVRDPDFGRSGNEGCSVNTKWQSPETAPTDGTKILGYGTWIEGSPCMIWVVSWQTACGRDIQYRERPDGLFEKVTPDPNWTGQGFILKAWMPLPDPPLSGQMEAGR